MNKLWDGSEFAALWEEHRVEGRKRDVTLQELKRFEGKIVLLRLTDGERLKAKLYWVEWEYDDVIVDVLETNQPEHYKDPNSAYVILCDMIESIEKCESSK